MRPERLLDRRAGATVACEAKHRGNARKRPRVLRPPLSFSWPPVVRVGWAAGRVRQSLPPTGRSSPSPTLTVAFVFWVTLASGGVSG